MEASTDPEIADLFAEFFQTTYSSAAWSNSNYPNSLNRANCIFTPEITKGSLLRDLATTTPTYSPGPDGLPGCVLKFCASTICKPILKLFSLSISSSLFPTIWKDSFIIPLHKKGAKAGAQNYRSISKLSAIPKAFERIITSHLQHLCSTTTNLLELSSIVINGFKKKMQTDVIYTDFSKAFDSVNHSFLLIKLNQLGFPCNLLTWISSYLNGRTQRVIFKNAVSKLIYVTSGVPQGNYLGPLLFTLFINDLPSTITHSRVLMYADDVKLCLSYNDIASGFNLQSDIDCFQGWCEYNLLNLNCVLLDPKLKFDCHIMSTVNKAMNVLGFIKRWSKEFDDLYTTKLLFTSLVRPILEYCSSVWSPQYQVHIDRIESVQK